MSLGKELPYKSVFQITEFSLVRSTCFLELFGRYSMLPAFPPANSSWDTISAWVAHLGAGVNMVGFVSEHFGSMCIYIYIYFGLLESQFYYL